MASLLLLNKPFRVLCQFTDDQGRATLADYVNTAQYPSYYPAGRLDYDSEGLVALTNDGRLQHQLANPSEKQEKVYWVQVEGSFNETALGKLQNGLQLKDGPTRPCKARLMDTPDIWERNPPIRERKNIPTHWLEITLTEGRNRQVRRMTAAVGLPTLRLVRYAIGPWNLSDIQLGQTSHLEVHLPSHKLSKCDTHTLNKTNAKNRINTKFSSKSNTKNRGRRS